MKKIGFIDYYLSEWHANNYPSWIEEVNEKTGDCFKVAYAWGEKEISPVDGVSSKEWAEKFGVELCQSVEELCEKSDYILILAPSDPEVHLRLCKAAFPCGKRTYVDKTFAPDYQTAKEIFELGEKYGVKFFSSSALRYAEELETFVGVKEITTTGGGSSLEEYIVHQVEMLVKTLGVGATRIRATTEEDTVCLQVEYADGRKGYMRFSPYLPFSVATETEHREVQSYFFKGLIADILRFYNEGTTSFDVAQTLEVMKIREGAIKAKNAISEWIEL